MSQFYGIAIYMYYRDHAPPHFHAIYGEDEVVFEIATGAVIAGKLPRRARVLVEDWLAAHQAELQQDWDLAVAGQPLLPVPPLDREDGLMILRIRSVEVRGPRHLWLSFSDGSSGIADVGPLLHGPVFEPMRDPAFFARVVLDPVCDTVVWPNGADFAPEALRAVVTPEAVVT